MVDEKLLDICESQQIFVGGSFVLGLHFAVTSSFHGEISNSKIRLRYNHFDNTFSLKLFYAIAILQVVAIAVTVSTTHVTICDCSNVLVKVCNVRIVIEI